MDSVGSIHFHIVPWSSCTSQGLQAPSYVVGTNDSFNLLHLSLPYECSTVWTTQRCSRNYTERRRGRKETKVVRSIKEGNEKERDRSSQVSVP